MKDIKKAAREGGNQKTQFNYTRIPAKVKNGLKKLSIIAAVSIMAMGALTMERPSVARVILTLATAGYAALFLIANEED